MANAGENKWRKREKSERERGKEEGGIGVWTRIETERERVSVCVRKRARERERKTAGQTDSQKCMSPGKVRVWQFAHDTDKGVASKGGEQKITWKRA